MISKVVVNAPAKLNLTLDITGIRDDGYHFMRMVMQTIDLYDELIIELTGTGKTELSCNFAGLACDESNLAVRAAKEFFEYIGEESPGIRIHILKNIPIQKGLAGGSTDAAAVLTGLNALMKSELSLQQLCEIGLKLGADVPFCIMGGTMLAEGIGEILSPLPALPNCMIVIATPLQGMCTTQCFSLYDEMGSSRVPDTSAMSDALKYGRLDLVGSNLCNVLEEVCPNREIDSLMEIMRQHGALGAAMSGSGTAVFGIFTDSGKAESCKRELRSHADYVHICHPCNHGAKITFQE